MSPSPTETDDWLRRQIENAKNDIDSWPEWLWKSSGSNAEKYSPWPRIAELEKEKRDAISEEV